MFTKSQRGHSFCFSLFGARTLSLSSSPERRKTQPNRLFDHHLLLLSRRTNQPWVSLVWAGPFSISISLLDYIIRYFFCNNLLVLFGFAWYDPSCVFYVSFWWLVDKGFIFRSVKWVVFICLWLFWFLRWEHLC